MKVRAITLNNGRYEIRLGNSGLNKRSVLNERPSIDNLSRMPYVYPISFEGGIQNSKKLRELFAYGLPCMYSGIKMIDPKYVAKLIKNNAFSRPTPDIINIFEQHSESLTGMEKRIFEILKDRAKIHPEKNIQELLKEAEPVFRRRLRKKQAPIFHELNEISKELPLKYRSKFNVLMEETNKKLNEKPIIIPFSSSEFQYKLSKIKDFILNGQDLKAKKVINVMLKESKKFARYTDPKTIENQRKVIGMLEWILKKSVLKNNEQLNELIQSSKSRLFYEEVIVPFSRKSFIYDLSKIINTLPNEQMQEKILLTAAKLPTSSQSFSAYFLKVAAEPPEKIGYRLLRPTTASVEHILPRSCGGEDVLSNFGGATAKINSIRGNLNLSEWAKKHPEIKENCQKYVDKLIELYHKGVFLKVGISPKYISDFKQVIAKQSKGMINVDISKL